METIYDRLGLELLERDVALSSYNTEQLRFLSKGLKDSAKVLDLGIGFGNLAKILIEQGKTVYGVDIRQDSLDYAKQKVGKHGKDRLHLVLKDVRKLDYDNEFDGASCVSHIGEFGELDSVFLRVYRALQKRGYFAVTGIEFSQMERMIELRGEEAVKAIREGRLVYTPEEIEKLQEEGRRMDLSKFIDSTERTVKALQRNGFQVLDTDKFYEDTSYFVLAQKD